MIGRDYATVQLDIRNGLVITAVMERMVADAHAKMPEAPVTVRMGNEVARWFYQYFHSESGVSYIGERYAGYIFETVHGHPYLLEVVCG